MTTREYLFIETDNACALCGLKGLENLIEHHIDEDRTHNNYDNLIVLCRNCHCRFHEKKGISRKDIDTVKKRLIVKTLSLAGLNALKIAKRNKFGTVAMPFMLYHLVSLGLMTKEENQMGYGKQHDATARFAITEKGTLLLEKWFE